MQSWNSSLWRRHTFICLELFFFFLLAPAQVHLWIWRPATWPVHFTRVLHSFVFGGEHPLSHSNQTQTLLLRARYASSHGANGNLKCVKGGWSVGAVVAPNAPAVDSDPSFADWWSWLRLRSHDDAWSTKGHRWLFQPVVVHVRRGQRGHGRAHKAPLCVGAAEYFSAQRLKAEWPLLSGSDLALDSFRIDFLGSRSSSGTLAGLATSDLTDLLNPFKPVRSLKRGPHGAPG